MYPASATLVPMLLLTGPAGSGKTTCVLDGFRDALRAGNSAIRLLAPTATLARHLQNRLAREGFVFRRNLVQTLSGFVQNWAGDEPQVPDAVLFLMVEEAALRVQRPEFARVVRMPGFCASLARAIAEFSAAGCDSARLTACLPACKPDAPLAAAFIAVYQEVDRELARRRLAMRATRLTRAGARIERDGLGGIATIWLDGFHALPDPELLVIAALGRHADITVTLGDADLTEPVRNRLHALGFKRESVARRRSAPAANLAISPNIEREVDEIALRILLQANSAARFARSPSSFAPKKSTCRFCAPPWSASASRRISISNPSCSSMPWCAFWPAPWMPCWAVGTTSKLWPRCAWPRNLPIRTPWTASSSTCANRLPTRAWTRCRHFSSVRMAPPTPTERSACCT